VAAGLVTTVCSRNVTQCKRSSGPEPTGWRAVDRFRDVANLANRRQADVRAAARNLNYKFAYEPSETAHRTRSPRTQRQWRLSARPSAPHPPVARSSRPRPGYFRRVLGRRSYLLEPDDLVYRASIVVLTQGHLTLTNSQYVALAQQLARSTSGVPGFGNQSILQWVHLANGNWVSEKNPGYPFLAAPFQALGMLRLAPLFFGGLACLGHYLGARRWLGRWGGTWAVG
jgi:hypothetical protein